MTAKDKRQANPPGTWCPETPKHDRSTGHTTYRQAMKAAEGDASRVHGCTPCEKFFIVAPGTVVNPYAFLDEPKER